MVAFDKRQPQLTPQIDPTLFSNTIVRLKDKKIEYEKIEVPG